MRNMNCVHRVWDDHVRNIEELYGVKVVFFNYFKHIRVVKEELEREVSLMSEWIPTIITLEDNEILTGDVT